jgi:diguanylate cyclase (GGDEF)-like protein
MQAAINAAVLHIHHRDELLKEVCRLATDVGGYERAIVSIVDKDGRSARPRFHAGKGEDFPDSIVDIADDTEPDTSLSARALRTGEVVVCNDLTKSEPPVVRRERLVELGYRSLVALPLIVDGHRLGVLTMSSKDEDLVHEEELLLLQDMAASLSFALRAQRHASEVQLWAYFDSVTGLANRALFCRRVDEFVAQLSGPGANPAVAAFHVYQLSSINDIYGRHFGDLLLQQVAERVKRHVENEERVGYLGAGTFVLLEPGTITSRENVASMLEGTVFNEPFSIVGRSIRVSCRTGVARYPLHGSNGDTLVRNAEAALAHARAIGEQYLHYAAEIHSEIAERLTLENRLRSAIDEQQFQLYYQPQINTKTGRIESLEGLLRWNDPEHGVVTPSGFLPVLEDSGMIVAVGRWVLTRAVKDCRRWADLHLGPVRVAVNVSPLQIRRRTFVEDTLDLVRTHLSGLSGYGVDLEITETTLLQDIEGASRKLQELRAAGVRIALDDFGTGYSSLGLLPRLPVDVIKMDRTFVKGLPADPASATLADSIVRLASTLGLVTVAEGVETSAQMSMLREMNCDQTQGYLHSAPLPAREIEKLLSASRH